MGRPYQFVSATYSLGMLLFWVLHVIVYKRIDPYWLSEFYMIIFYLPAIVGLKFTPTTLNEDTYRHFLRTSFYILIAFDFGCLITGYEFVIIKRWLSALIMICLPLAFLALFLKLNRKPNSL